MTGKIPQSLGGPKGKFTFNPVHSDDLALGISTAYNEMNELKGHKYTLSGEKGYTLSEMLSVLEGSCGQNKTKLSSSFLGLRLTDFVEEFFVGIAHDKNMGKMAEFFE